MILGKESLAGLVAAKRGKKPSKQAHTFLHTKKILQKTKQANHKTIGFYFYPGLKKITHRVTLNV